MYYLFESQDKLDLPLCFRLDIVMFFAMATGYRGEGCAVLKEFFWLYLHTLYLQYFCVSTRVCVSSFKRDVSYGEEKTM